MKDLNYFYNYAIKQNIKIKNFIDKNKKVNGLCMYNLKKCNIYINSKINNSIQEKCVLAEEIGHYKTGILETNLNDTSNNAYLLRSINEFRAKKWAVNKLIPFDIFKSFIGTNLSNFEIAEHLEVTEEILDMACFIYEPLLYD